jgi:DNA replication protein DnaC
MSSKCVHCKSDAVPVWDSMSEKFKPYIAVCLECFKTKEHHEYPFNYLEVFTKNHWQFAAVHPSTPSAFLATKDSMLSAAMQKAIEEYRPSKTQSILLHGVTGTGKTRAAWRIYNMAWLKSYPQRSEFITMRRLEQKIEEGFKNGNHGEVLERLIDCAVLCIDDLGKERLTARMESDLFAIIDERTANERATIITTNYNGSGLSERFQNSETGSAIVRRLKDYFKIYGAS